MSGNTAVVGAPFEDSRFSGVNSVETDNSLTNSGAAYVFVRAPLSSTWIQQAYLKASNTGKENRFGYSVAVSDDTVIIGAPLEDSSSGTFQGSIHPFDNIALNSGAAYVFMRSGTT